MTLQETAAASKDQDLQSRAITAAQLAGIPAASTWVAQNMTAIVNAPIDDTAGGQKLTDVYTYAAGQYVQPLSPGANPAVVQDTFVTHAVNAARELWVSQNPAKSSSSPVLPDPPA